MTEKYPLTIRLLHWLMALLIIGLLIVGFVMSSLPNGDPMHGTLVSLHKSFGITVLALALVRLVLRLTLALPPLPESIPRRERLLAHLGHWRSYGFMVAMPLSGYLMSASYGLPVKCLGILVPRAVSIDKARGEQAWDIHSYGAYALVIMLLLHVGAVLLHYLRERVNLLKRML